MGRGDICAKLDTTLFSITSMTGMLEASFPGYVAQTLRGHSRELKSIADCDTDFKKYITDQTAFADCTETGGGCATA